MDGLRGHMRALGEIWGLVFAGFFDAAERKSADIARTSSPGQCLAWGMDNVLASTVEVARGHFRATVSRLEQTVAVLISESTAPHSFGIGDRVWDILARLYWPNPIAR